MFHFLISTWDDLQFLELLVSLLLSLVVMNIAGVVNRWLSMQKNEGL